MNKLDQELKKERKYLQNIIQITEGRLRKAPEGSLRVSSSGKKVMYYHCTKDNKINGTYISKENTVLISRLAQKDYDEKVLRYAKRKLRQLEKLGDYNSFGIQEIYQREHQGRKIYIEPIELTWEEYKKRWMEESYQGKGFKEGETLIYTEKGERVRSKICKDRGRNLLGALRKDG